MDVLDFRLTSLRDYLSDEAYQEACRRAHQREFKDGQPVHARGDESPRLCIVTDGAVRIGRVEPDGSFKLVNILGPGRHFGDLGLQRAAYTHDGYAVGDCKISVIDAAALEDLLRNQPGFAMGIWRCNTARLNALLELYEDARTLGVMERLAEVIMDRMERLADTWPRHWPPDHLRQRLPLEWRFRNSRPRSKRSQKMTEAADDSQ